MRVGENSLTFFEHAGPCRLGEGDTIVYKLLSCCAGADEELECFHVCHCSIYCSKKNECSVITSSDEMSYNMHTPAVNCGIFLQGRSKQTSAA